VREIAAKRRTALTRDMTDEDLAEFNSKPMNSLIVDVLKELEGIAGVIKQHAEGVPLLSGDQN
jgi:hypothetical protein